MTITTNPSRDEYTSGPGQTVFNYTFKIYANNELDVYVTPAGQQANDATDLTTDYVVDPVTIGDENGGFITFNTPLNNGDLVTIVSGMDYDRTVDYQVNGDFIPSTVNTDNDRQVSQIKQVLELARKAVVFGQAQQSTSGLTSEAPESGKFIRWKDDLSGFENTDLKDLGAITISNVDVIYPTVALMKADSLNVLDIGVTVSTQGYYSAGDGGGATYLIVANQAVDGFGDHLLGSGNVALLQSVGSIAPEQYGMRAGAAYDNKAAFDAFSASDVLELRGGDGDFYFGSAPAAINKSKTISGFGRDKTKFIKNYDSGTFLDFSTTSYIVVEGITISAGIAQTSGSYIKIQGIRSDISDCFFLNHFLGIDSNTTIFLIDNCEFRDGVGGAGSGGILVAGSPVEVRISHVVMDSSSTPRPDYGIWLQGCDAVHIVSSDIINCGKDLFVNPQNGEVATSIKCVDTYFDSATRGVSIEPNAGASVQFVQLVGCWTSSHSDSGLVIDPAIGATVDGVELIGHQSMLNAGNGIVLGGGAECKNVRILGGAIGANGGRGIFIGADVSLFSIKDVVIGPSNQQVGNASDGVLIDAGTSNNFDIEGNDLRGNGAALTDLSSGTAGRRITANKGYNDTASGSAITVGASPFNYTAGDSPETVYLISGTVSGVIQAGQTIANGTGVSIPLEPLESIQVTYSAAPFMNKVRH